jgi:hypothetical protein
MSSSWTDWTDVLLNTRYSVADTAAESGRRSQRQRVKEVTVVHTTPRARRLAAPLAIVAAMLALGAGSAHASLLPDDGAGCRDYSLSQVFLPWADPASYTPAPGGSFEKGNGHWTLVGASRDTADNEPYRVGGAADHSSLAIADGGTALSPAMCVGLGEPDSRVFFKQTGGLPGATLQVDVLFDDVTGTTQAQTVAELGVAPAWVLSPQILTMANLLPTLGAGSSAVAFRFTAIGGSFKIDDLYVDPYRNG